MCFASCREIAKLFFELLCQIFLPIGFIWIVVSLWEVVKPTAIERLKKP